MALSTARIHRVRGRPPLLAAGIISLIHSHSSSVRSLGYVFSFIYPFYTTHEDFSDSLLGSLRCGKVDKRLSMVSLASRGGDPWIPLSYGGAMATPCVRRSSWANSSISIQLAKS